MKTHFASVYPLYDQNYYTNECLWISRKGINMQYICIYIRARDRGYYVLLMLIGLQEVVWSDFNKWKYIIEAHWCKKNYSNISHRSFNTFFAELRALFPLRNWHGYYIDLERKKRRNSLLTLHLTAKRKYIIGNINSISQTINRRLFHMQK